jgi:hypothetical protein
MASHFKRNKYRDEDRVIGPALTAIERSYDVLLALPEHDSARFFKLEDHQKAADTGDVEQACLHLLFNVYNWLKFFWWTSAFKSRQLAAALVQSYNSDNLLAWLILGRSSLEYAAVSYYFQKDKSAPGPRARIRGQSAQGIEDLLLQYAHGTRFNWPDLFAGNREALGKKFTPAESTSAVNVLTALDHLAKRDARYADVRIGYDMLSDFAHPNMASHASVVEMPTEPGQMHECQIAAQPGSLRGEFIMVVNLPWVSTGLGTIVELLIEIAPLLERWLTYLEGGTRVTIDFTK